MAIRVERKSGVNGEIKEANCAPPREIWGDSLWRSYPGKRV